MPLTSRSPYDSKTLLAKYYDLPQPDDKIQVMYVWIDGSGENLRCKTMTLQEEPKVPEGTLTVYLQRFLFLFLWINLWKENFIEVNHLIGYLLTSLNFVLKWNYRSQIPLL